MKKMNKKDTGIFERYLLSEKRRLSDCYGRYSTAKERAYKYCANLCAKMDGCHLKIIGYNTSIFTVGFIFPDPETGEIKFMYITPSADRIIEIDWSLFE